MEKLKPCPYCNSMNLEDCYVYIRCNDCLMTGPKMNKGNHDDHSDFVDHENAIMAWNDLSIEKEECKCIKEHEEKYLLITWNHKTILEFNSKKELFIQVLETMNGLNTNLENFEVYDLKEGKLHSIGFNLTLT